MSKKEIEREEIERMFISKIYGLPRDVRKFIGSSTEAKENLCKLGYIMALVDVLKDKQCDKMLSELTLELGLSATL